ncbi:MAG: hypothetical protein LBJ84_04050 [Oscillospiraceae bacterium]|nr:hypothetical protein [Oscillospiraceae bacterium]
MLGGAAQFVSNFGAPLAVFPQAYGAAKNAIKGDAFFEPAITSGPLNRPAYSAQALNEGVNARITRGLDDTKPLIFGMTEADLARNGYGLVQSMASSAANIAAFGPASIYVMGAQAAGNTSYEAAERGLSPAQALAIGVGSGIIEGLTEKYSVENFLKFFEGGSKMGLKLALKEVGKQMLAEGSEEVAAEVLDTALDMLVAGDMSEFEQYKRELIAGGMGEGEANSAAIKQFFVNNVLSAGVGGAVSGGVFGAFGVGRNNYSVARNNRIAERNAERSTPGVADGSATPFSEGGSGGAGDVAADGATTPPATAGTPPAEGNGTGEFEPYNDDDGFGTPKFEGYDAETIREWLIEDEVEDAPDIETAARIINAVARGQLWELSDADLDVLESSPDFADVVAGVEEAAREAADADNREQITDNRYGEDGGERFGVAASDSGAQGQGAPQVQGQGAINRAPADRSVGANGKRELAAVRTQYGEKSAEASVAAEIYTRGYMSVPIGKNTTQLPSRLRTALYRAGNLDAETAKRVSARQVKRENNTGENTSPKTAQTLDRLAEVTGVKINVADNLQAPEGASDAVRRSGLNGWYDPATRTINLNSSILDTDAAILTTAMHEVVHDIQQSDAAFHAELTDAVRGLMGAETFSAALNELPAAYRDMSAETREAEVVANYIQEQFGNEQSMNRMLAEKPGVVRRVLDAIRNWIANISSRLTTTAADRAVASQLQQLERRIGKMMRGAGENAQGGVQDGQGAINRAPTEDSGETHSPSDAETAERAQRVLDMEPQKVKPRGAISKSAAEELARSFGAMENENDGRVARLPIESAQKIISHKGYETARIFGAIPELYETAIPAWSEGEAAREGHKAHTNIKAYHHYVNKFNDGSGDYYIRFTVTEANARPPKTGDNLIHSTAISDVEVYKADNKNGDPRSAPALTASDKVGQPPFIDTRLQQFFDSVNTQNSGKNSDDSTKSALTRENIERNLDKLPKYSIAYHGTPHTFDEFLLDHIGEGEGAQAHGWGLYFAAEKKTAINYQTMLAKDAYDDYEKTAVFKGRTLDGWHDHFERLASLANGGTAQDYHERAGLIDELLVSGDVDAAADDEVYGEKARQWFNDTIAASWDPPGNAYTVDIPDEDVMLHEDLELSEQPEKVKAAIRNADFSGTEAFYNSTGQELLDSDLDGRGLYRGLSQIEYGEEASMFLNSIGIKGIAYDGRQDGKSYVVFDDKAIKILDDAQNAMGGVRYSLSDAEATENKRTVAAMQPVATLTGDEFRDEQGTLLEKIKRFFAEKKSVDNPDIGRIDITASKLRASASHGIGSKKAAAYAALPEVLQGGKIIGGEENHQGKGYDTAIIAAPVTVGSTPNFMGAVVNRYQDGTNGYYVHEVLSESEAAAYSPNTVSTNRQGNNATTSTLNSVLQELWNVKREISGGANNAPRFSLSESEYAKLDDAIATEPEYAEIRRFMRTAPVSFAKSDRGDGSDYGFDSYNDMRKQYFSKLKLVNEGGETPDGIYQELQYAFGKQFFPDDITNPMDKWRRVLDVVDEAWANKEIIDGEERRLKALRAEARNTPNSSEAYNDELVSDRLAQLADLRSLEEELDKGRQRAREYPLDLDTEAQLAELRGEYKEIPRGEIPEQEVHYPRRTSKDRRVRQFVRTAGESGSASNPDSQERLAREVASGTFSYEQYTDKFALKHARGIIDKQGYGEALKIFYGLAEAGTVSKDSVALGEQLIAIAAHMRDADTTLRLIREVAALATTAGQAVQAVRMLKRMSGEGQLKYLERVRQLVQKGLDERMKKPTELVIPEDLAQDLLDATTQEGREDAVEQIYQEWGAQLPASWLEKWNAWRYFAMLFNTRTHVRNFVGNVIFIPALTMKNLTLTALEATAAKRVGAERTTRLGVPREYRRFAGRDFAKVRDMVANGAKLTPENRIRQYQRVFKTQALEAARKFNYNLLEMEDGVFLKLHYTNALARYLYAHNIDISSLNDSVDSWQTLDKAREYAAIEAQKATYRDSTAVSKMLTNMSKNRAGQVLVEGIQPFKRTPISVLKRGLEYSPLGLLEAVSNETRRLRSGKITANQWLDRLASGLSGSVIWGLGMWLASIGLLRGGNGDEKEDKFEELRGLQPYSINIDGKSYTLDWMAPVSLPLFVGVETWKALKGDESAEERGLSGVLRAMTTIAEPMFNLSMLSGFNDVIEAVRRDRDGIPIGSMVTEALLSYFGQGVPSMAGQFARAIDEKSRRSYVEADSLLPQSLDYFLQRSVINRIPGLAQKLSQPYIDEWGREESRGNIVERIAENFISPGFYSEDTTSDTERELLRLYDALGEDTVFPQTVAKYFTVPEYSRFEKGMKEPEMVEAHRVDLSASEYTAYAKKVGATRYDLMTKIIASSDYGKLSDVQKSELVSSVYGYATALGKAEVSDYQLVNRNKAIFEAKEYAGIEPETILLYFALRDNFNEGSSNITQEEARKAISSMKGLDNKAKAYLFHATDAGWKATPYGAFKFSA